MAWCMPGVGGRELARTKKKTNPFIASKRKGMGNVALHPKKYMVTNSGVNVQEKGVNLRTGREKRLPVP